MNNKLLFKLLISLAILSALVAGSFVLYDFIKVQETFPPKTLIGNIDVSNLTAQDATAKVNNGNLSDIFIGSISLVNSKESFSFSPEDLGVYTLGAETVKQAFELSHKSSYFKDLSARLRGKYSVFPGKFSIVPEKAKDIILELAQQTNTPSMDARIIINEKTGGYNIFPEKPGRKLDVEKTIETLKREIENGNRTAHLSIIYFSQPRITEQMLREAPPVHRLSAYTTYYGSHDSPNRIHNIKLIASWVDNTLLLPNEVLSLTDKIGDFTAERGFREAYVIMKGELVPQLGGGTCQIGTTLYNAVEYADLEVLSRRNHSFYFNIYPLGRDATVYPGSADFKFKNNSGHPILIKAIANDKKLSFRLYGTKTGKDVKFSSPKIFAYSSPEAKFVPTTLRRVIASDAPFRTVVIRTVKNASGEVVKEETIRSYYKLYGEKSNVPIRRREVR